MYYTETSTVCYILHISHNKCMIKKLIDTCKTACNRTNGKYTKETNIFSILV